jgi:hypothetical protein
VRSGAWKIVGAVAAVVIAACVDLSAPKGGPASISQLQLPAFFVVQGDTMRDTLGRAMPPTVVAYDGAGGVLTSFKPRFFITDSLQQLHFSAIDSSLVSSGAADTAGAVAHVVAQIGSLQTGVQTVYVTVRPDTLRRPDTTALAISVPIGDKLDSSSSIGRLALSTVVRGVGGRPVPGVFVRYTLASSVASRNDSPAAYLTDDANAVFLANSSSPDTGDVSGVTSRTLVVNSFLATERGALLNDTLVVLVTAMYGGSPLRGSPLRLLIPVTSNFTR